MKKYQKKGLSILFSVVTGVVLACTLFLSACAKTELAQHSEWLTKTLETVSSVTASATVKEGETLVYSYSREAVIEGSEVTVTTKEQSLNDSFALKETTDVQTAQLDRAKLCSLNLSDELVTGVGVNYNVLTGQISKSALASVLGVEYVSVTEEGASLWMVSVLSGERIASVTVTYTTVSNRTVEIKFIYA